VVPLRRLHPLLLLYRLPLRLRPHLHLLLHRLHLRLRRLLQLPRPPLHLRLRRLLRLQPQLRLRRLHLQLQLHSPEGFVLYDGESVFLYLMHYQQDNRCFLAGLTSLLSEERAGVAALSSLTAQHFQDSCSGYPFFVVS